jgi:hypothetical protein
MDPRRGPGEVCYSMFHIPQLVIRDWAFSSAGKAMISFLDCETSMLAILPRCRSFSAPISNLHFHGSARLISSRLFLNSPGLERRGGGPILPPWFIKQDFPMDNTLYPTPDFHTLGAFFWLWDDDIHDVKPRKRKNVTL